MREILFRGIKTGTKGEWIEGYLLSDRENQTFYICENIGSSGIEVYEHTVSQFTGLLDKTKNKIFEGDIVKARAQHVIHPADLFKVKEEYLTSSIYWCPSMCAFEVDFNGCLLMESNEIFEIIGNIHEN